MNRPTPHLIDDSSPTPVFDAYWRFAAERQAIYWQRSSGIPPPWSEDNVLAAYRFTNAYRALDRVSQFLLSQVIYVGDQNPDEVMLRILLFKVFNKIETWNLLVAAVGIPASHNFSVDDYREIFRGAVSAGKKLYSAAYIMPPVDRHSREPKCVQHLRLVESMVVSGLARAVSRTGSLEELVQVLWGYQSIGPFLGYQYAIDLNYSGLVDFSEMDYVIAGPGALRGLMRCFRTPRSSPAELIRAVCDAQEGEFERRGLRFRDLYGRRLQLVDCQNLFCEIDKYSRVAFPNSVDLRTGARPKQRFRPAGPVEKPFLPPKWGLNTSMVGDAELAQIFSS